MKMIKENKLKLVLVSLVTLLPILAGVILWDKLPTQMPMHWGPTGEVDGYASKAFAVFFMPAFMVVMLWICIFVSSFDKKNREHNKKANTAVWWIIPSLSIILNTLVYLTAMGKGVSAGAIMTFSMGLLFVVIGNYMPKVKQNYTLGVKVKWTLESEANWNATHRLAGKLWFFGGFGVMLLAFLPETVLFLCFFAVMLPMVIIPVVYSWCFSKKENKNENN